MSLKYFDVTCMDQVESSSTSNEQDVSKHISGAQQNTGKLHKFTRNFHATA